MTITEINRRLENAGIEDKAFTPRNGPNHACICVNPDKSEKSNIVQAMRNIGYILEGDWDWQVAFRKAK